MLTGNCDVPLGVVYEDEVDDPDTFTLSPLSKLIKIGGCGCGGAVIWGCGCGCAVIWGCGCVGAVNWWYPHPGTGYPQYWVMWDCTALLKPILSKI